MASPLGEPFADDFNFLRHAFFHPGSWLDGGGAAIYWRPLSRQAYYALMGPWMVTSPWLTVGFHVTVAAAASLLVYRAFRAVWSGPWAAAAASFPLLSEPSRTFLLWPTTFQDLGALFFSALAIHEASRRRLPGAIVAVSAGLLCKETAVVTALLVPWLPFGLERRTRWKWAVAFALTVAAWGACYAMVLTHGGVSFQSQLEGHLPSWLYRLGWALGLGFRDALGIGALPRSAMLAWAGALAVLLGIVGVTVLLDRNRRARLATAAPWIAWGAVWFLINTALLTQVYPLWGPFRAVFGGLGLGVALVAITRAVGPAALGALIGLRLIALLASPGPPERIASIPIEEGAALDFTSLVRLSRLTAQTHEAMRSTHPTLPAGATVTWLHRPLMTQHAFAHGEALHAWYRDSTLRWVVWDEERGASKRLPDAILEFGPDQEPQVLALNRDAVAEYVVAEEDLAAGATAEGLERLMRADSLQTDRRAQLFLATLASERALCRLTLNDLNGARREAERSLGLWRDASSARYVLALLSLLEGRLPEARAQLDTLLERFPSDASALALRDTVMRWERTGGTGMGAR